MRKIEPTINHRLPAAERPRKQTDSLARQQGKNVSGAKISKVSRIFPCSSIALYFVLFLACSPGIRAQSPSINLKSDS